ncbi:transcription termination/antitermination protein NusG [Candidatus Roizmanbacteria bacterium RIFCSPLOWO2_01_FULL_38_12]|uniref:Transcription termination/antitermination protein NusG n=1 Tax=Candidatus Roizmanbacteria bacterium RIFCSPLOWO2_01_FULL_38_12 TaxID=1802061 RepID=A0A1F7J0K6_9BACT|nr:MAG: transcription termination/antitermination protein NusG [Candidatus Roizmanbacteria bacterium RIFCSPHIGHO2_01_FULL_38_15]OGK34885.1 MAG: transcription termination/antitermination protein NusG [Candidatus Roizmanbacteria bacterium RIFCSPHIGHO2_12_FULL_38_13]OGK49151.1 MAG: transcription termination/antitermination protein NusG [Candidatus Roizmanbacteria bacterium RIFCSPLOWO2_01_FULL_38_12]
MADETTTKTDDQAAKPDVENQKQAEQPVKATIDTKHGKWYVLHSQTGHENRVKNNLEQRINSLGVQDKIFDIIVPTREIVVIKKGKKAKQKEKVFPGYIFVRMELNDESWLVVRTTEGVTGFIGAGLKPTPISDKEVQAIMRFVQQEQPKFKTKFSVGEAVKITEGPFADFLGSVETIDEQKGKIKVLVSIFDRETPVELDFLQVKKL